MDTLDQIIGPATPLLRRVDQVLSGAGAPADHRVWAELRRVRLLPGDAVQAVSALRSADLLEAAPELRADARAYLAAAESLPKPGPWSGAAAESYDEARRRMADHLSGGLESLDERLEATADLADALIEWIDQTRAELAGTLAQVLGSSQALTLTTFPAASSSGSSGFPAGPGLAVAPGEAEAAADVGARILHSVADSYELASDLLHGSTDLTEAI
jgi:hypothetical protein